VLAFSAIENYVEIYYLEGELRKKMVRNTLKNIREVLSNFNYIQQCHRSYLVNLEKITEFNGNAQGLSLNFGNDVELQIPVSRKFVPEIKKALKED
jgi:DNA-binding LytR/AlgR family response regulator